MPLRAVSSQPGPVAILNVLCSPLREGWRVHLGPEWVPPYLIHCFDENLEGYTPDIDLEDLDRYMQYHGAQYEKRISKFGDAELTATGDAAEALAAWLSTVFATGVRERPRSP